MTRVYKFVEESCWDRNNQFRQVRKAVVFRIVSVGKICGIRLNKTFVADFGVFYDPLDEWLIGLLEDVEPSIAWNTSGFVYWKRPNHSGIDVIDTASDRVVAKIVVNAGSPDPSGEKPEVDMTNVADLCLRRAEMESQAS